MTFGSTFGRVFSPTFQPKSLAGGIVGGTVTVVAVADTYIISANSYNYGGLTYFCLAASGARKGLLRFNLSAIPSSANCTAAKLTFTQASQTWAKTTYYVYEIASANGDWVEGTAITPSYINGASCWNQKAYNSTNWAGSAGLSTAGTDYVDTLIATAEKDAQTAGNTVEIPFNASGLTVVKSWFGQSTNSGILVLDNAAGNGNQICSRENATESYRPTLTVTYS